MEPSSLLPNSDAASHFRAFTRGNGRKEHGWGMMMAAIVGPPIRAFIGRLTMTTPEQPDMVEARKVADTIMTAIRRSKLLVQPDGYVGRLCSLQTHG